MGKLKYARAVYCYYTVFNPFQSNLPAYSSALIYFGQEKVGGLLVINLHF
jgi:hypothetical protein